MGRADARPTWSPATPPSATPSAPGSWWRVAPARLDRAGPVPAPAAAGRAVRDRGTGSWTPSGSTPRPRPTCRGTRPVEREATITVPLAVSTPASHEQTVDVPGGEDLEELRDDRGRVLAGCAHPGAAAARADVPVQRPSSPYGVQLDERVANLTPARSSPGTRAPAWLRRALVAAHLLVEIDGGRFVSSSTRPSGRRATSRSAPTRASSRCWRTPATRHGLLSSPIILYDHPHLAPERDSAFFDPRGRRAAEPAHDDPLRGGEARGTWHRPAHRGAARPGGRDPPDLWDRLHGTVR